MTLQAQLHISHHHRGTGGGSAPRSVEDRSNPIASQVEEGQLMLVGDDLWELTLKLRCLIMGLHWSIMAALPQIPAEQLFDPLWIPKGC